MSSSADNPSASEPQEFLKESEQLLGAALAMADKLHVEGVRDSYRQLLERTISAANAAVELLEPSRVDDGTSEALRWILLRAHAARAESSRYGAGQLSRSAQRAPTEASCEQGWARVASIVETAEQSAREVERLVREMSATRARPWQDLARRAAQLARAIVDERNHAYTFHANPRFSFGEGWYLAAAAALRGVLIQVEPNLPQTEQAEAFLVHAGLSERIVPYRPRPRANKALPAIVADAFRDDPLGSARKVRKAFLGDSPLSKAVEQWAEERLANVGGKKVLLWVRFGSHHPSRNTDYAELLVLSRLVQEREPYQHQKLVPVLIGDCLGESLPPAGALDLTLFWKEPLFQGVDTRLAQLQLFEIMRQRHGLIGQLGVTTAGMDGPALLGLATMYLTREPNVRLGRWVGAIPGYEEVVRSDGYLDLIRRTLWRWQSECATGPRPEDSSLV